ncbi:hypothetical protein A2U01_0087354, partial [Trifolium medium]|nr:hypothetical protein [Trifolium medium]
FPSPLVFIGVVPAASVVTGAWIR